MALRRVWIASPNYSGRGGSGVRLCVVHTAEGATGYRNLGAFFARSATGVSSHTGIDDERGVIGEYVRRQNKAWTAANYNPMAIQTELCGKPVSSPYPCGARWSAEEWNRHAGMLVNLADWIREECQHYGLPITKLSAGQAQGSGRGVCGHGDLGAGGGGHYDPGPNFPWSTVMSMARGGAPAPAPKAPAAPPPAPRDLEVAVMGSGGMEVFSQRSSGEVVHKWQQGTTWSGWSSLGRPGA